MACGGDEAGCDDTIDDDKDGIGNCTEATLGTDPADDDSDDDGLLDGKEVELETDPLVDDTDADGLLDGQEVDELETDPLLADTDGDGMDDKTEVDCVSSPTPPPHPAGTGDGHCPAHGGGCAKRPARRPMWRARGSLGFGRGISHPLHDSGLVRLL